jgi:CxxC-x17-CxxC domain-containing protein
MTGILLTNKCSYLKQEWIPPAVYWSLLSNRCINMYQGNWKCSGCGGSITELPFQPRSESGLTCRTCYVKQRNRNTPSPPEMSPAGEAPDIPFDASIASEAPPFDDFGMETTTITSTPGKPRVAGNWQCSDCGGSITSLPFTPRNTSNLKCLDCFKASRN